MKKITLIVVVLALVTLACGLQRVTPTPVPPNTQPPAATDMPVLPTQAPAATDLPILPTTPSLPSLPPQGDGILYQDDFSTSNSNWQLQNDADFLRELRDGALVLGIVPTMTDAWTSLNTETPGDVQIDVDVTKLSGPDKSDFGVMCGLQDRNNFFALTAGPNGLVEIFKYVDGTHTEVMSLDYHPAVLPSGTNHISAVCQGSTLRLAVNGQEVATATDTSLKPGGSGLIIGTFEEGNVNYAFDNLVIRSYSGTSISSQPAGELLYTENFDSTQNGWDDYTTESSAAGTLNQGVYRILVNNTEWEAFGNPYRSFDDGVDVSIDAAVVQGQAENGFGVICGYQDIDNFFALLVGTQGYAEIVRYTADGREMLIDARGIATNPASNRVRATCGQNELVLYVNGVEALRTTHADLRGGDVGLIAGSFGVTPVEVHFDNLEVRRIQ